jgi:hypothetical protein
MSSEPGVFACGDARSGPVAGGTGDREDSECARGFDQYLMGHTDVPASPML